MLSFTGWAAFLKSWNLFFPSSFSLFWLFFSFRCSSQNSFLIDRQPTSFASPRKSFFNDRSHTRYLESSTSHSSTAVKNGRFCLSSNSFSFNWKRINKFLHTIYLTLLNSISEWTAAKMLISRPLFAFEYFFGDFSCRANPIFECFKLKSWVLFSYIRLSIGLLV